MSARLQLLVVTLLAAYASIQEPVRQDLLRQQRERGLTLASFYGKLETVDFAGRLSVEKRIQVANGPPNAGAVSRDGETIAFELSVDHPYRRYPGVARSDGSGLREYPGIVSPSYFCWSHDKSRLALNAAVQRQLHGELMIVELESKAAQELEAGGYVTSQCWSPDDRQVVYGIGDSIRIYDLLEKKSRDLARGEHPTWSPDGNWIAFHDHDAFYAIRPSGTERKRLFSQKDIRSGLWWSPDGSVVAYMSLGGKYDPRRDFDFVPRQLRVRRLADNSEDWVLTEPDVHYLPSYQWVLPASLR